MADPVTTPLVNQEQLDEWNDRDLNFSIPSGYNQEPVKPVEKDPSAPEEEPVVVEPEQEIEYVADPGLYKPADYSFEVTTYDDENKNPKNHTIKSVEDWDKLMEDDVNLGSAVALTKAMRLANKMEINSERDQADWQKKHDDYESVVKADTEQTQQLQTWSSEMDYLVDRGDLPKISKADKDANWSDPEIAKKDGVKEQIDLLKFMDKENKARAKSGLKQMTSVIDAYNAYQLDQNRKGTQQPAKQTEAEQRRAAGARIAGTTSNPGGAASAPKGVAVGRGGSLDDLGASWWQ